MKSPISSLTVAVIGLTVLRSSALKRRKPEVYYDYLFNHAGLIRHETGEAVGEADGD